MGISPVTPSFFSSARAMRHTAFGHVAQKSLVGIGPGTFRNLENDGRSRLDTGRQDGLKLLHVVEVVSRNGVAPLESAFEHLPGVDETMRFCWTQARLSSLVITW
jgi:hypothetical protein